MTLVMVSTLIATEKVLILTLILSLLIMVPVNHTMSIIMMSTIMIPTIMMLIIIMMLTTTILIAISPVFHSITDMLGLRMAMVNTQELLTPLKTSTPTLSLTT